jgi:uncharacterized protein
MHIVRYSFNMHGYIHRDLESRILCDLLQFPAVAILGPRQCGKTTLAKHILEAMPGSIILDLESPSDIAKLRDPELFFELNKDRLVCIDEVQRKPELFPILRVSIDRARRPGRFLLLGSASRDLVNRSSESLAGRISFAELTPLLPSEWGSDLESLFRILVRGGFPDALLEADDSSAMRWLGLFIRTYMERDLPLLGFRASSSLADRLLHMCAHDQGQVLNSSKLGESLGLSHVTLRSYLDFVQEAMLLRLLPAWQGNLKKRLIKSPKLYLRDCGICNALLGIRSRDELMGHPSWGMIWESLIVESVLAWLPDRRAGFYRTSNGAELDLVLELRDALVAVECKASTAPKLSRGFYSAIEDLELRQAFVCAPIVGSYRLDRRVTVCGLRELKALIGQTAE